MCKALVAMNAAIDVSAEVSPTPTLCGDLRETSVWGVGMSHGGAFARKQL